MSKILISHCNFHDERYKILTLSNLLLFEEKQTNEKLKNNPTSIFNNLYWKISDRIHLVNFFYERNFLNLT